MFGLVKARMSVSTPLISFSDGIGHDIDEKRFEHSFFKNLRGAYNQSVNPFARTRIVDSPNEFQYFYPSEYNRDPESETRTACCNHPQYSIVIGRKMGQDPTEDATQLKRNATLLNPGRKKTTRIIGLDTTENS